MTTGNKYINYIIITIIIMMMIIIIIISIIIVISLSMHYKLTIKFNK